MPRISAADIDTDDIVVLECNFTRWKKPAEAKKKGWTTWDVGFELISISHVYSYIPELEPIPPVGNPDVPAFAI